MGSTESNDEPQLYNAERPSSADEPLTSSWSTRSTIQLQRAMMYASAIVVLSSTSSTVYAEPLTAQPRAKANEPWYGRHNKGKKTKRGLP